MDTTSAPNSTSPLQPTDRAAHRPSHRARWRMRWHWQAMLAVLLALVVVDGHIVADTYAASGIAARAADVARRVGTPSPWPQTGLSASPSPTGGELLRVDARPDFQIAFVRVADGQPGMAVSYTIQIRNEGNDGGMLTVSTVVPVLLTNVRASAPGFGCTRRFTPSGEQAGTLVTCTRNDLESGATAELTVEANASDMAGSYALTATVDPRNEVAETDEANNAATATLRVHA
ncbi:MAG: hypothetical protein IT306_05815 [Chloroflexi bacterium]|nr:hypothetical protein [Chloroflexota bacterium]